ncbi:MAG: Hpt domain-containing protein [Alphaproteobacteria bacterium]
MPENNNEKLLDLSTLMEYADGDEDVLNELIQVFYEETTSALNALKNGINDEDTEPWRMAAHRIKGSAGYVGADNLRQLCTEAQQMINSTTEERQACYKNIENSYTEVEKNLKEHTS